MIRGLTYCLILVLAVLACSGDEPVLLAPQETPDGPPTVGLSIGPVRGLTTAWHPAPARIAVPAGTDVLLACGAAPDADVTWTGAVPTRRESGIAYALCRMPEAGVHVVRVETGANDDSEGGGKGGTPNQTAASHECVITAVDVDAGDIRVSVAPTVSAVDLADDATNEETMRIFYAGGKRFQALSTLREVGPGHYRTAVNRMVRVEAKIEPEIFASMIEWRSAGESPSLGIARDYLLTTTDALNVAAGPPASPGRVRVDAYRVEIVSRTPATAVDPGVPITFQARTVPAGFEDEITWLSSTKYGRACPVLGNGPVFTAVFEDVWGPHPDYPDKRWLWLGVRADNAVFDFDLKFRAGGLCELAILEFVGRPAALPPNGALHFPHIPCAAYAPVFAPSAQEIPRDEPTAITGATVCYYDITAANLNAACDSIFKAKGPVDPDDGKRHAGSTEMEFTANWKETASSEGTSTIHVESVTHSVKVWLPRWTNVPSGDQAAWNSLISELEKHEQGHVDRYNNTMTTVNTQVTCTNFTVASSASDSLIGAMANAKVKQNAAYQAGEQDQQKYDAPQSPSNPTGTNHGTQNGQNASWPSGQFVFERTTRFRPPMDRPVLAGGRR
jgi:predicted secreted Zn-dependent protease